MPTSTASKIAKTLPLKLRTRLDAAVPKTAMILAAGLGTRMMPLTKDRSKAMVELKGRPLIDYVLTHLEQAGVTRVVVNLHAHADHLQSYLNARKTDMDIIFSDERDQLLDTGGAIRKAAPFLGDEPILVVNCDAFWRDGLVDTLAHLASRWDPDIMDSLLLIVHSCRALGYYGTGDFDMDPMGRLKFRKELTITPYVYAGVHILKPALATTVTDDVFSLRQIWQDIAPQGRLYGLIHEGFWAHVGTPDSVKLAERRLLD